MLRHLCIRFDFIFKRKKYLFFPAIKLCWFVTSKFCKTCFVIILDIWHRWKFRFAPLEINFENSCSVDRPCCWTGDEHPLWFPFLMRGNRHTCLGLQRLSPRCPHTVAEACQPWQPYNIQSESLQSQRASAVELFDSPSNLNQSEVPWLHLLLGMRVGGIEDIPSNTEDCVDGVTLSPPEPPNSLPEFLGRQLNVLSHDLNSSYTRVFASVTAWAADYLACW